jgi:hypothetical protein
MLKWIGFSVLLLVCAFVLFSLALGQSLRRASLIKGKNALRVALDEFNKGGRITNYSASDIQVWLSTNVVNIGGTQYVCFAQAGGGWGYEGGSFAMSTNQVFIWLDPERPPKIITNGYRPVLFSKRF